MLDGDRLALARLITRVENRMPDVPDIMRAVHPRTGRAYVLGVTGPPGAGKSTLVDRLTAGSAPAARPVGVIAVDPSSPFTGGAVLGDRIRMQTHTLDPEVFIRSMATRGSLGGLARATGDVIKLMDAFGFPWIIIETVGVGQTELDVIRQADTTVVTLVPESGDSIQAMKAGLMEVADVFVVNKADRDGAHALMAELRFSVHLHYTSSAARQGRRLGDAGAGRRRRPTTSGIAGAPGRRSSATARRSRRTGALETRRQARRRAELRSAPGRGVHGAGHGARARRPGSGVGRSTSCPTGALDPYSAVAQILGAAHARAGLDKAHRGADAVSAPTVAPNGGSR